MRILIAEDYAPTRNSLSRELREEGHAVDAAADGHEGLWFAEEHDYDVIVLDLMLPGKSGWEILHKLRSRDADTQIIVLTARDSVEDRVRGLDEGADDYVVKPFAIDELKARIRAAGRRKTGVKNPTLHLSCGLELNTVRQEAKLDGRQLTLTPREMSLLTYLVFHKGQLVSRADIWENIYEFHANAQSNVVDVYMARLRKKLVRPGRPPLIVTRRGQGYIFEDHDV